MPGKSVIALCLMALWAGSTVRSSIDEAMAGSAVDTDAKVERQSQAKAGKKIFNGKGVCSSCHGIDGYRNQLPQLAPDTATLIARLNPPPPDLRNPKSLRLVTERARAKIIREGHLGTGMFPDSSLSNQEVADLLAYLAQLRRKTSPARP